MTIQIICRFGTNNEKLVSVEKSDPLYVLLTKLKIKDKNTKFLFNEKTFSIASIQTFEEIGLTSNTKINLINQAISGKN